MGNPSRHTTFLNNLIDDLLEEQGDGTNYDGWNEIMNYLKKFTIIC